MSYSAQGVAHRIHNAHAKSGPFGQQGPPLIPMDKMQLVPLDGGAGSSQGPSWHGPGAAISSKIFSPQLVIPKTTGSSTSSTGSYTPGSGGRTPRSGSVTPRGRRIQLTPQGAFLEYDIPKRSSRSPSPMNTPRTTSEMLIQRLERFKQLRECSYASSEASDKDSMRSFRSEREEKPLTLQDILNPTTAQETNGTMKELQPESAHASVLWSPNFEVQPIPAEQSPGVSRGTLITKKAHDLNVQLQELPQLFSSEETEGSSQPKDAMVQVKQIWPPAQLQPLRSDHTPSAAETPAAAHPSVQSFSRSDAPQSEAVDASSETLELEQPLGSSHPGADLVTAADDLNTKQGNSSAGQGAIDSNNYVSPPEDRALQNPPTISEKRKPPPLLIQSKSVGNFSTPSEHSEQPVLDPDEIIHAGALNQEDRPFGCLPLGKKWVKRYAVVQPGRFQSSVEKGAIMTQTPGADEVLDLSFGICAKRSDHRGEFSIHIGRRKLAFKADGEEDRSRWLSAFLEAAGLSGVRTTTIRTGGINGTSVTAQAGFLETRQSHRTD